MYSRGSSNAFSNAEEREKGDPAPDEPWRFLHITYSHTLYTPPQKCAEGQRSGRLLEHRFRFPSHISESTFLVAPGDAFVALRACMQG